MIQKEARWKEVFTLPSQIKPPPHPMTSWFEWQPANVVRCGTSWPTHTHTLSLSLSLTHTHTHTHSHTHASTRTQFVTASIAYHTRASVTFGCMESISRLLQCQRYLSLRNMILYIWHSIYLYHNVIHISCYLMMYITMQVKFVNIQ